MHGPNVCAGAVPAAARRRRPAFDGGDPSRALRCGPARAPAWGRRSLSAECAGRPRPGGAPRARPLRDAAPDGPRTTPRSSASTRKGEGRPPRRTVRAGSPHAHRGLMGRRALLPSASRGAVGAELARRRLHRQFRARPRRQHVPPPTPSSATARSATTPAACARFGAAWVRNGLQSGGVMACGKALPRARRHHRRLARRAAVGGAVARRARGPRARPLPRGRGCRRGRADDGPRRVHHRAGRGPAGHPVARGVHAPAGAHRVRRPCRERLYRNSGPRGALRRRRRGRGGRRGGLRRPARVRARREARARGRRPRAGGRAIARVPGALRRGRPPAPEGAKRRGPGGATTARTPSRGRSTTPRRAPSPRRSAGGCRR